MNGTPFRLPAVENRHYVGVNQTGGRPSLGLEAASCARLLGEIGAQDLHRHPSSEPPVGGIAHGPHPTMTEHRSEFVAPSQPYLPNRPRIVR